MNLDSRSEWGKKKDDTDHRVVFLVKRVGVILDVRRWHSL